MNECILKPGILATALSRTASVSPYLPSPIDTSGFWALRMAYSPLVLTQTVFYGKIMCIYPAKWDPVAAITFFETGCDISQNAKQLIIGQTVSAAGMCAYACLFSCLVVLTLEVLYPNSRLHDTDHHRSYPSPGPPRTLLCIWRRLWALVHRSTHRPCKHSHMLFLSYPDCLLIPATDRLLGYVNSVAKFSPLDSHLRTNLALVLFH